MTPAVFARVANEILPWSSELSLGVGGEPTVSDTFIDYLLRARELVPIVRFETNGARLEDELVAEAVAHGASCVELAVDAATEATYERMHPGSSWARMRRGLAQLDRYRSGSEGGCQLTLGFTLTRANLAELPAFVDLAAELGADGVRARHLVPVTAEGCAESLIHEPERFDRVRALAVERAERLGIALDLPRPYSAEGPDEGRAGSCSMPVDSVFVASDGRVFPCYHPLARAKLQLGDLSRESFADIWNRRTYRSLRAGTACGDVPGICQTCSLAQHPPRVVEDPETLLVSPTVGAHYGDRDLDRPGAGPPAAGELEARALDSLLEYASELQRRADELEAERVHLAGHAANLEAELGPLRGHARAVDTERRALREHSSTLERELAQLSRHAATLESERPHLQGHAANLEAELAAFRQHAAALEAQREAWSVERTAARERLDQAGGERDALAIHARDLEEERGRLREHAANLEHELGILRRRAAELRGWKGPARFLWRSLSSIGGRVSAGESELPRR